MLFFCTRYVNHCANIALRFLIDCPIAVRRLAYACMCALLVACLTPSAALSSAGNYLDIQLTPGSTEHAEDNGPLRADALEAAEILHIRPYVELLRAARQSGVEPEHMSRAQLNAKYLCLTRILAARMEVRKFVVSIKKDLDRSYVALDTLVLRNQNAQDFNNSLNFMQIGVLAIIKQKLLIQKKFAVPPYLLTTLNANATGLSAMNLIIPSLCIRRIDEAPNGLNGFLDESYHPRDAAKNYLWRFFESPIPGGDQNLTRRQLLVRHLSEFQHVNLNNHRQLRRLSATPKPKETLYEDAKTVSHRISLLFDLRSHVEEFDYSLYELHKSITDHR